jgi:hypothetical protein
VPQQLLVLVHTLPALLHRSHKQLYVVGTVLLTRADLIVYVSVLSVLVIKVQVATV